VDGVWKAKNKEAPATCVSGGGRVSSTTSVVCCGVLKTVGVGLAEGGGGFAMVDDDDQHKKVLDYCVTKTRVPHPVVPGCRTPTSDVFEYPVTQSKSIGI
jgi:hypothetical protein